MTRIVIQKLNDAKDIRNGPTTVFAGNSTIIEDINLVIGSVAEISGIFVTDTNIDRLVKPSGSLSYFNDQTIANSVEYVKASGDENNAIVLSSGTLHFNPYGVLIGEN